MLIYGLVAQVCRFPAPVSSLRSLAACPVSAGGGPQRPGALSCRGGPILIAPLPTVPLPQGHQPSKHRARFIPLNLDARRVSGYIRARRIIVSGEKPAGSEHPPRGQLWPMGMEGPGREVARRLRDSSALAPAAQGHQAKFISPVQALAFWFQRVQLSPGSLRPRWHPTAFGFRAGT